jgi:hypothetical protein
MGEEKHWRMDLVQHEPLPPFNPRDQSVLLDDLREKAVLEFAKLRGIEEDAVESTQQPELA